MRTVTDYIKQISAKSRTAEDETILECLDHFGVAGTKNLTLEQAAEFWEIIKER